MKKIILIFLGILIFLFCFWFFYLRIEREERLIKEGNKIVRKIENFKNKRGRLPKSLEEIGEKEEDDYDAIYYLIQKDSINYNIYFGIGFDESKIYYSDSKKWEDFNREMKLVSDSLK
ncbi:hypothetical protein [Apibacter adventoris]|uniref:Uncharacterized protein n=1 Tax=Apibacter adventoris TaxID=1679466 RepID=A0A2S8AEW1_9FLAO|nr:hypothetical protein [Apibacter adventoris]PQL93781.1 hypothetical protein C4S77_04315 [Apibacter adventoris]